MEIYAASVLGLLFLCLMPLILAGMSGPAKGKAGLSGGPVLDARDDNPVFRIDRAHMNAVEALAPFAVPAVLAMLVGVGPVFLAVLVWAQVGIRLAYTVVYLRGGAPARGGSLRTFLYLGGFAVNLVLVVATGWIALT